MAVNMMEFILINWMRDLMQENDHFGHRVLALHLSPSRLYLQYTHACATLRCPWPDVGIDV